MHILYRTNKLERQCTDAREARRDYGQEMAVKLSQRIQELRAADSIDMLVQFRIGRCHALIGDLDGCFAMDLAQPYRLLFERAETDDEIHIVRIVAIKNYH